MWLSCFSHKKLSSETGNKYQGQPVSVESTEPGRPCTPDNTQRGIVLGHDSLLAATAADTRGNSEDVRRARDGMVAANLPAIVTVFSIGDGSVVHQNPASVGYLGQVPQGSPSVRKATPQAPQQVLSPLMQFVQQQQVLHTVPRGVLQPITCRCCPTGPLWCCGCSVPGERGGH